MPDLSLGKGMAMQKMWFPQLREQYAQARKIQSGEVHPSQTPGGVAMLRDLNRGQAIDREALSKRLTEAGISGPMLASLLRGMTRESMGARGDIWSRMRSTSDPARMAALGMGQALGQKQGMSSLALQKYLAELEDERYGEAAGAFPLGEVIQGAAGAAALLKSFGVF